MMPRWVKPPVTEQMKALNIVFRYGWANKAGIEPVVWMDKEEEGPVAGLFVPAAHGCKDHVIPMILFREPEGREVEAAVWYAETVGRNNLRKKVMGPGAAYGPFNQKLYVPEY